MTRRSLSGGYFTAFGANIRKIDHDMVLIHFYCISKRLVQAIFP